MARAIVVLVDPSAHDRPTAAEALVHAGCLVYLADTLMFGLQLVTRRAADLLVLASGALTQITPRDHNRLRSLRQLGPIIALATTGSVLALPPGLVDACVTRLDALTDIVERLLAERQQGT